MVKTVRGPNLDDVPVLAVFGSGHHVGPGKPGGIGELDNRFPSPREGESIPLGDKGDRMVGHENGGILGLTHGYPDRIQRSYTHINHLIHAEQDLEISAAVKNRILDDRGLYRPGTRHHLHDAGRVPEPQRIPGDAVAVSNLGLSTDPGVRQVRVIGGNGEEDR